MAADTFEDRYLANDTPWDIGRAQSAFVARADAGEIKGRVLDVGCGTGDNAILMAIRGHEATGVDSSPTAIERARHKAEAAGAEVRFLVGDVLNLHKLKRKFDTVIDSGLFHALSDEERPLFKASLESVTGVGATYVMLCFSEDEPPGWGPRRVTQEEIRDTFRDGWRVNYIRAASFDSTLGRDEPVKAWLASLTRVA